MAVPIVPILSVLGVVGTSVGAVAVNNQILQAPPVVETVVSDEVLEAVLPQQTTTETPKVEAVEAPKPAAGSPVAAQAPATTKVVTRTVQAPVIAPAPVAAPVIAPAVVPAPAPAVEAHTGASPVSSEHEHEHEDSEHEEHENEHEDDD